MLWYFDNGRLSRSEFKRSEETKTTRYTIIQHNIQSVNNYINSQQTQYNILSYTLLVKLQKKRKYYNSNRKHEHRKQRTV